MKGKRFISLILCMLFMWAFVAPACTTEQTGDQLVIVDTSPDDIQYMIWQLTNTHHLEAEYYVQEMKVLYGDNDPESKRMYGFGLMGPMLLNQSIEQMRETINVGFDLAERYNIPVYFQMDDQNNYTGFFGNDTDIRFWEDPSMCEWIAFPEEGEDFGGEEYGMLPRFWFNWGNWLYAPAVPNFESPGYKALIKRNIEQGVIIPIIQRYQKLMDEGKGYLFAGIACGWECHIPNLSDPQFAGMTGSTITSSDGEILQPFELQQYGYGALNSLGYTQKSLRREAEEKGVRENELIKSVLYQVIADHLTLMSEMFANAGFPRHKVFTHIVSLSSVREASTFSPPISTSVNPYAIPGFTMSPVSCVFNLEVIETEIAKVDPDVKEFALAEGYCAGYREEEQATAYFEEFFGGNCRLITCFGYTDPTGTFAFDRSSDFGFVKAINKWLSGELMPGFVWADRFN